MNAEDDLCCLLVSRSDPVVPVEFRGDSACVCFEGEPLLEFIGYLRAGCYKLIRKRGFISHRVFRAVSNSSTGGGYAPPELDGAQIVSGDSLLSDRIHGLLSSQPVSDVGSWPDQWREPTNPESVNSALHRMRL